ncbi:hypothetical protein [Vibrio salinus]|uniref:hypothetical protein n=1 Tax=Vibrio salinus TaxID=2899784 RepID=UPI001E59D441|nr:hypothetical protein [Vibrio salinus]MCE0495457.1 hypothetical protein [Vibrio salinus]
MVDVYYQHRVGNNPELVNFSRKEITYRDACKVIDDYPWESELALFEQHGEGGGFNFVLSAPDGGYADYQFTPVGLNEGFLDLTIVLRKGVLGMFGRKSVSVNCDVISARDAKIKMKELFDSSLLSLYEQYR